MHGILKLRAMIQARPDLDWRTRYGGRGTEEFVESELAVEPVAGHAIGVSGRRERGHDVPDATGLELIAQEVREAHDATPCSTPRSSASAPRCTSRRASVPDVLEHLRAQGLSLPRLGARRSTTSPRSRASASSTSCST